MPLRFVQGMAMGSADVIPGVSGGTVALILGVYTTLVASIRSVASAVTCLLRGNRAQARGHWQQVPWRFVLPLGIGMLTALGIGSLVLPPLLEAYPVQTSALFFGLIIASLIVPWRETREGPNRTGERRPVMYAIAAACAVAAFLVTGLPEATVEGDLSLIRVFLSAAVAICAMILPGVSGAFLLLVLGVYEPTLEAVKGLDLAYVATFGAGAVIGLGVFSKLLSYLLEHRLAATMAGLAGLMLGALRVLWPWGGREGELNAPPSAGEALVALALMVLGIIIVRVLLSFGDRSGRVPDAVVGDE